MSRASWQVRSLYSTLEAIRGFEVKARQDPCTQHPMIADSLMRERLWSKVTIYSCSG